MAPASRGTILNQKIAPKLWTVLVGDLRQIGKREGVAVQAL
jgi:hypothetical protein